MKWGKNELVKSLQRELLLQLSCWSVHYSTVVALRILRNELVFCSFGLELILQKEYVDPSVMLLLQDCAIFWLQLYAHNTGTRVQ